MREGQSFHNQMDKHTGGTKCPHCDTWYRRGVQHGQDDLQLVEKRAYARGFEAGKKQSQEKPLRNWGKKPTYDRALVLKEYEAAKALGLPKHKMMARVAEAVGCALTTAYLITRKHRKLRKPRSNKALDSVPS